MQRYAHLLIILPVFLLDRWTKILVEDHLRYGDATPVFSWLSIVNWRNTGGLFGIMAHHGAGRYLFLLIPLLIIGGIAYYVTVFRLPP